MASAGHAYDRLETVMTRQATEDQSKLLADMRTRVESAAAEIGGSSTHRSWSLVTIGEFER